MNLLNALFLITVICANSAQAKTNRVAVIDTGIDSSVGHICETGHKDFSSTSLQDEVGHGTHVAGLIIKNAANSDYCLINIKFYNKKYTGAQNVKSMISSLQYAIDQKVDYINISGGGPQAEKEEQKLIQKALDMGIKIVVAAGNEGSDLSQNCNFFPACYDSRLYVVGNLEENGSISGSSNYGRIVNYWQHGTNVISNLPNNKVGRMSGTSQAAAIFTGKLLNNSK
jgi:subtilisin family serine protease